MHIVITQVNFCMETSEFAKNILRWSSSHVTSSLLSPGPPAQCPQIEGKACICPMPALMFFTSISESSGLQFLVSHVLDKTLNTHGKYRSVFPGRTSIFAFMPCMAFAKSPS